MNKYIFVNLKRFDISPERGGVNRLAPAASWAPTIVTCVEEGLEREALPSSMTFPFFFPEAHILGAAQTCTSNRVQVGCQSVHSLDTEAGKNFGAFTTSLTANAAQELGCTWTIIGHSEERAKLLALLTEGGVSYTEAQHVINRQLNLQAHAALKAGLNVLFCIGERADEIDRTKEVLQRQLDEGLSGIGPDQVVIGYEPLWAIGPGKIPPNADKIKELALLVKELFPAPVVYGGGLKRENAKAIGAIEALDGGLVALTRFSGEIGFYPDEYLEIVRLYCEGGIR